MAITFVGQNSASGTGNVTPALPAGVQDGDLLILHTEHEGNNSPAGLADHSQWNRIAYQQSTSGSAAATANTLYCCFYDSVNPPNRQVNDPGDHCLAVLSAWRGVDRHSPIDAAPIDSLNSSLSTSHTAFPVTTLTSSAAIVLFTTHGDDGVTIGSASIPNASSTSVAYTVSTASGSQGTAACIWGIRPTAGASGTISWTSGASEQRAAWTLALRQEQTTPEGVIEVKRAGHLASAVSGTTLGAVLPGSYAAGDLAVMVVAVSESSRTFSTPSGWTLVSGSNVADANLSMSVFYKILGSSESNPSTTISGGALTTSAVGFAKVHLFGPVDASAPIADVAVSSVTLTSTNPATSGVTASADDSLAVSFVCISNDDDDALSWLAPSGWFPAGTSFETYSSADVLLKVMASQVDAGSVSAVDFGTPTDNDNYWRSVTLVLNAGEPPPPPTDPHVVDSAVASIATSRSPSLTFASPPQENDIVIMWPSSTGTGITLTIPSGWENPLGGTTDVESDAHQICCVAHRVTSGEAAANTVTFTATNLFGANTSGNVVGCVVRLVDTTTMFDAAASAFSSTNSASPHVLAGLTSGNTPTVDGALVLSGVAKDGTGAYSSAPSGWTFVDTSNTSQGKAVLSRDTLTTAASSVSATNITPSAGDEYASITVALRPAPDDGLPSSITAALATELYPHTGDDYADGAAIVPFGADTVVLTTSKQADTGGLYVYNLEGEILSSVLYGASNSVDWRDLTGVSGWDDRLLVMSVDRDDDLIRYYWMDRTTKALTSAGSTSLAYEPYGSCLYVHSNGNVYAFISDRGAGNEGEHYVRQYLLTRSSDTVSAGSVVRTFTEEGVMEGMAADDTTGYIYVSREDYGLYRYSANPGGSTTGTAIDELADGNLFADVEDVAIARTADGTKLLVSSQGDNSYHVYDAATLTHEHRFTAFRPNGSTPLTGTDGLDVYIGNLGGDFPNGLIVLHDAGMTPVSNFGFFDAADIFGELPAWDGSFVRIAAGTLARVRMADADAASLRLSNGGRL